MNTRARQWGLALLFAMLAWIHLARVLALIPVSLLKSEAPLTGGRFGELTAAVLHDRAFMTNGHHAGYDPFQMAGHPAGNVTERRMHFSLRLSSALTQWSAARAVKFSSSLLFLALPFFVGLAGFVLADSAVAGVLAFAFGVITFAWPGGLSDRLALGGNLDLLTASYLFPLAIALHWRPARRDFNFTMLAITTLLLALANTELFAIFFIVIAASALFSNRQRRYENLLAILPAAIVSFITERQYWEQRIWLVAPLPSAPTIQSLLSVFIPSGDHARRFWWLLFLILIVTGFGFALYRKKFHAREWIIVVGATLLVPILWQGTGLFVTAPHQLLLAFFTLILAAAACGVEPIFEKMDLPALMAIWFVWFSASWPTARPFFLQSIKSDEERYRPLIDDISRLPEEGRVLFEDGSNQSGFVHLLPAVCGREFIGTPVSDAPVAHYLSTNFVKTGAAPEAMLAGRRLSSYSENDLERIFSLYNIRYVVAFSVSTRYRFDSAKRLLTPIVTHSSVGSDGFRYRVYEVNALVPTFFLDGQGRVKADWRRISVTAATSTISLKYHWDPSAQSSAGSIAADRRDQDAVPFLQIKQLNLQQETEITFRPSR